jgi:hypothetical protein
MGAGPGLSSFSKPRAIVGWVEKEGDDERVEPGLSLMTRVSPKKSTRARISTKKLATRGRRNVNARFGRPSNDRCGNIASGNCWATPVSPSGSI